MLMTGMMLQDRYEILEKIGSGGMSDVYKAKCHKLNRLVAIKVLKAEFTSDAGFVSKFKMEAQAAAGLSHPNIVNVYDVVDEGELHYIVMELVEGITLKSYIAKKGRLDVKESIGIAIQVAQGIEAAHEQHIIHRDIKPQNMLISKDGKVKVADFGIARAVSSQTMNATVVGSVHYISPEQARGGYSDERSDIYSLGITMYEMVTGRVPFEGDNTVTVALAHLEEPIAPPGIYNPEIPLGFEKIILKCTEKRPENRYPNAAAVISDLRRALIDPDDPAIAMDEETKEAMSQTITISPKELEVIQFHGSGRDSTDGRGGRERTGGRSRDDRGAREDNGLLDNRNFSDDREFYGGRENRSAGGRSGADARGPRNARRDSQETGKRPGTGRIQKPDEATQLEKVLTVLGVLVAIIVVAVVIVFFVKLGGVFNRGSSPTTAAVGTESVTDGTESSEEESASLSKKEVLMPKVEGMSQDDAEKLLKESDLEMRVTQENSDEVEKGYIISQANEPGSVVQRFSEVSVVVSAGSDKIDLTSLNITQMTLDTAVRLLEGKGLKTSIVEEANETVEQGNIIRFEPADKAAYGDTVTLYVSTGPAVELVTVPEMERKTEEEALKLLSEAGLLPGQVTKEHSSSVAEGSIISQGIEAGSDAEKGSAVDYVVSLGPEKPKTQFLASLEASYPLMVSYGPGAASSEITIMIRLKQTVNGEEVYTKLTDPKTYSVDTTLDIRFTNIRGADGVLTGEVQIVDLTNNKVLNSYNVNFVEFEVS